MMMVVILLAQKIIIMKIIIVQMNVEKQSFMNVESHFVEDMKEVLNVVHALKMMMMVNLQKLIVVMQTI
jgi:hypothetical protein